MGLVATDELRIAGLCAVLSEAVGMEIVLLSEPGSIETSGIELVMIDASSTSHVLELLKSFRRLRPKIRLMVVGGGDEAGFIEQMIGVGARAVLSHEASENEVRMAVEVVREGSVWAPRKVLSRLLDRASHPQPEVEKVRLTEREREVLLLLIQGMSNREIAATMKLEQATIKAHLGRLMRKAGVENRTALGMHAMSEEWV